METKQGPTAPIEINDRLQAYENKWVVLDADYQVIASADHLTKLLNKLSPAQQAEQPTFVQVRRDEDRLERMLIEGLGSGAATPMTKKKWKEIRDEVRKGERKRTRAV